jgi:hypothetical protein
MRSGDPRSVIDLLGGQPNAISHQVMPTATCIAQSKIVCEVLEDFGIEAMALPVVTECWNDLAIQSAKAGMVLNEETGDGLIPGAMIFAVSGTGEMTTEVWAAHMVVYVPSTRTLIDPTLGQFSHPEWGVPLPLGLTLHLTDDQPFNHVDPDSQVSFEGDEGQVIFYRPAVDIDHSLWQACTAWTADNTTLTVVYSHYIEERLNGANVDLHLIDNPNAAYGFTLSVVPHREVAPPAAPMAGGLLGSSRRRVLDASSYHRD